MNMKNCLIILAFMLAFLNFTILSFAEQDFDDLDFLEDEEADFVTVRDPLEPWNRLIFKFNDRLYYWVFKPTAQGYKKVTTTFVRQRVSAFFKNLGTPVRLVNALLQFKGNAAAGETVRFLVNSTIGFFGFFDLAQKELELAISDEDMGQTLAFYGCGNGFYVVWPFLGPSSLRDTVGLVGDSFWDPLQYLQPMEISLATKGLKTVNTTSFRIGDYETLKTAALDPYVGLRDAYFQIREHKISE